MDSRGADDAGASRRTAIWRLVAYGTVVVAIICITAITGALPSPDEARDWGEDLGDWVYVAFVPLFVVVNFAITWPILAGAAGLLFGTAVGTPLALTAVTVASVVQMFIARRLASGHHGSLLPKRTRAVEEALTRNGAIAVMESRIVPLLPFGVVNFSAGLTRMPYRDLALGTIVGAAPKVFAYVALGGSLSDLNSPAGIAALALLVVLGLAGALLVRRQVAPNLPRVTYFQAVRIYSLVEVCIFTALLVVAIGGFGETAETALGWTHGFGWIALCLLVAHGCRRGTFPWALLAATVSPLGPIGCTAGIEYLARRRRRGVA